MKKIAISAIFILGFILLSKNALICAAGDERFADVDKILTAYGCLENGQYNYGAYIVTKAKLFDSNYDITSIERIKNLLDTPEEFITVSYLKNLQVIEEVRGIIQNELPRDKIGALRLSSMWLKKKAEYPENATSYQKVVYIIKNDCGLTDGEMKDYFAKAVENEVLKQGNAYLGKWYSPQQLKDDICKPIIEYYIDPTQSNKQQIVMMWLQVLNKNQYKGEGYIEVLIKSNDKLATTIINKIHEARLKK
jgi:hypothetical protein